MSAHFSDLIVPPIPHDVSTTEARTNLTEWLHDTLVRQQFEVEMEFGAKTIPDAIIETAYSVGGNLG